MRKIFKNFVLCTFLLCAEFFTGGQGICSELPGQVFANGRIVLKNREVKEEKGYLFTRVDLKLKSGSTGSLLESKAALYAQRNFAIYVNGKIAWNRDFSSEEQQFVKALFWQVTSASASLRGLTLIRRSAHNGLFSFIYAIVSSPQKIRAVSQDQVMAKIQMAAKNGRQGFDYLTYLELGLRKPQIFNPKIAVKQIGKTIGSNFIFFLLGMDLNSPTDFERPALKKLAGLSRNDIAALIDKSPYNPDLIFAFANNLLETGHMELAKLTLKSGFRLHKSGEIRDQIFSLIRKLDIEPGGEYFYPIKTNSFRQLFIEIETSDLKLSAFSEAVLNSLGDVPLKASKKPLVLSEIAYSKMDRTAFLRKFHELQDKQKIAVNKDLLESTADLLIANGYPYMAYCFWHQALYLDKSNANLRSKISDSVKNIEFVRYSKLLSPIT